MSSDVSLPNGFESLEVFVSDWVLPDSQARTDKRQATTYETIKEFYDAVLAHAPLVLAHLRDCELGSMSAADERLLKLMLSLAEVGPCVEWYGQPQVKDGFDPARFSLTVQLSDTAAQVTL